MTIDSGSKLKEQYTWFEGWYDWGLCPQYFLALLYYDSDQTFRVFDPREEKEVITFTSYEDARNWLGEDEFHQITGRMTPND